MREYIAIDIETTGLSAYSDRIVELGAVRFDASGNEINRFQSLINPGVPIPPQVSEIHGIVDVDVVDSPSFYKVASDFFQYLLAGGTSNEIPVLIAHNAQFDVNFINEEIKRSPLWNSSVSYEVVDTLPIFRRKNRFLRSHSLSSLAAHYNLEPNGFHRSICDCLYLKDIWILLEGHLEPECNLRKYRIFK